MHSIAMWRKCATHYYFSSETKIERFRRETSVFGPQNKQFHVSQSLSLIHANPCWPAQLSSLLQCVSYFIIAPTRDKKVRSLSCCQWTNILHDYCREYAVPTMICIVIITSVSLSLSPSLTRSFVCSLAPLRVSCSRLVYAFVSHMCTFYEFIGRVHLSSGLQTNSMHVFDI